MHGSGGLGRCGASWPRGAGERRGAERRRRGELGLRRPRLSEMVCAEGRRGLFVRRRGDLGVRARGWKAGAIGVGDLGFGCARKTKLAGGAHGSAAGGDGRCAGCERRLADVRAQVAGGVGLRRGTRAAGEDGPNVRRVRPEWSGRAAGVREGAVQRGRRRACWAAREGRAGRTGPRAGKGVEVREKGLG